MSGVFIIDICDREVTKMQAEVLGSVRYGIYHVNVKHKNMPLHMCRKVLGCKI